MNGMEYIISGNKGVITSNDELQLEVFVRKPFPRKEKLRALENDDW